MDTQLSQKFAGPLAHCVLDLVFAMLAILGVYRIPPRAKGAPPRGDPRHWELRLRRADDPPTIRRSPAAFRNPTKKHPKIMIEFGTAFERNNAPQSLQE